MKKIYFKGFELDLLYLIWACVLSNEECEIYTGNKEQFEMFQSFMNRLPKVNLCMVKDGMEFNYDVSDIHKRENVNDKPLLLTYCKYLGIPYSLNWRNPVIKTNVGKGIGMARTLLYHDKKDSWITMLGDIKEEKVVFIGNEFECKKFKELSNDERIEYKECNTVDDIFLAVTNLSALFTNESLALGIAQMTGVPCYIEVDINRNTNFLLN